MEYLKMDTLLAGIPEQVFLVIILIAGILLCLFGLKFVRVWGTIAGILAGAVAGQTIAWLLHGDNMVVMVATIAAGFLLGMLDGIFKKVGIFVLCLTGGFVTAVSLIMPSNPLMVAICAGVSLIVTILAMILEGPVVIVATGLMGAVAITGSALPLLGIERGILWYVVPAVAAVIGIVVQFLMKSGEIKKKEMRHAQSVKEEISMEAELEQLRSILDDDDDDDDDEMEIMDWNDGEDAAD